MPDAATQSVAAQKDNLNLPLQSAAALKKEDVRRTIMFVVDDTAMSFENGYYTKMSLRNFVEKQMQPGDMVSIVRTDYGNSALNMFHSDKREALARINSLPTTMTVDTSYVEEDYLRWLRDQNTPPEAFQSILVVSKHRKLDLITKRIEDLLSTISFSVNVLKNMQGMPGRKILIVATPSSENSIDEEMLLFKFQDSYDKLADESLRAGIVVNSLDINGLTAKTNVESWSPPLGGVLVMPNRSRVHDELIERLAARTGGVAIRDSNFFLDGIGRETESMMRGYYLISYEPPPDTFEKRNKKEVFHRLKVNVKRSGAKVHTRDGFFGRLESEMEANTPENPLLAAINSPFKSTELNVNIAAGYVRDKKAGYLVRSWIHLDPEEVKIIETGEGNRIELEAVYVATDINGKIQDSRRAEFSMTKFKAEWVKKHGIRFSMLLPVKKAGSYYIRISIEDKGSEKVGSAYQFLEIPEVGRKEMALSDIFMITSAEDLKWIESGGRVEGVFFPMFEAEEVRSPALRSYRAGDNLLTMAMLYNAEEKAIERSELETQTILYKEGKEYLRGKPSPVTMEKEEERDGIPIVNRLTVSQNMPPGDYMLQILVRDKRKKGNEGASTKFLGFSVRE
jgi:VWFA-related protein